MKRCNIFVLLLLLSFQPVFSEILSQWRGPGRDGKYPETGLLKQWPAAGPKLIWDFEGIGNGFSSPAVTSDRVYVLGEIDKTGFLHAFDHQGNLLWKIAYGPSWTKSYPGSRSIPTIVDDKIYFTSGMGVIYCLNASDGKTLWSLDYLTQFSGENLMWGVAESPLVYDNKVIVTPGGNKALVAALDKDTGKTLWTCTDFTENSAYCSPVLVTHNGQRTILTMTEKSLLSLNPDTGKLNWRQEHKTKWDINPNTPYYFDGKVITSSGYGTTGTNLFKIAANGKSADLVWNNGELDSQIGAFVVVDGYMYGSGHDNSNWQCIDIATGKTMYESDQLRKKGNIIFADGMLYCYDENGQVALVKPNPQKFELVSQFKITKGNDQHWAHTVIKNKRMYIRHGNALMVYDIGK